MWCMRCWKLPSPLTLKKKLAEWLSLALDPETGQVGDTDGGM